MALRGLGAALFIALAIPASADAATASFGFTGAEQTFVVPAGVSSVHVVAIGAAGASGGTSGGRGASVSGELPVAPGQTLFVEVGGKGSGISDTPSGAGGFNGGADGGGRASSATERDWGGGGASDVRTVSTSQAGSLGSRLLIAGGGGGAGEGYGLATGGDAGSPGGDGTHGPGGDPTGRGGGAGTTSAPGAGGAAGAGGGPGVSGGLGVGGAGGPSSGFGGGGGGGGLYGGGGGGGSDPNTTGGGGSGGGGGGSSFTDPSVSSASTGIDTTGVPSITISFQDPGGGGGGGGGGTDGTPPSFTGSAKADPSTFAVDSKGTKETAVKSAAKKKPKKGTTFRYTLSEAARVVFTIERRGKGRKVGKTCKPQTASNRKRKACTRYTRVGAFAQQAHAGKNTKKFSGRIGKTKLSPGSYRATLLATDAAGNRSKTKQVTFKVVKP